MRRIISLAVVVLAVLAALPFVPLGPVDSWVISAHPGPHPPIPPTHDYDTARAGTQGPVSPMLAWPTGRLFSAHRLSVTVMVPIADLQDILPPGFAATPLPAPNPPGMAGLGLQFDFLGQCDRVDGGPSGSASGLYVLHGARNNAVGQNELLVLAAEFDDQSWIDCHRAMLGPGGSRLADVEAEIEHKQGQLKLTSDVEDEEIGLRVKIRVEGPATFNARNQHADPAPTPVRTLEQGLAVNPARHYSIMADAAGTPITDANFQLTLGRQGDAAEPGTLGRLGLPGGSVRVMGFAAAFPGFPPLFVVTRWFENFFQLE